MSFGSSDLIITVGAESYEYVLNADDPRSMVHTSESPNVPLNTGASTPTQAGGVYDVRDSEGDKAITHLDWSGGAGQKSLDTPDAAYSRFFMSKYIDTSVPGQIGQQRPFTHTHYHNTSGPIFSALGKLWMGLSDGTLKYSSDNGTTWASAVLATPPSTTIGGFASDGTSLYACCSGAVSGLWKWDGTTLSSTHPSFTKFSAITAALEQLAYNGGTLYGATGDGAGVISTDGNGTYTEETADFITGSDSTIALVSTQNAVYWVLSKGENAFTYRIWNDAGTVYTEQFAEYPTGFVATCALGYLGNVDVGGYFTSYVPSTGQGAVYRTTADGEMSILFRIGEKPEDTADPTAHENDNRIRAAVAGGLSTYWLTEREVFRWDLRSGGYVHMGEFLGCGAPARVVTAGVGDTLPTGGTIDDTSIPGTRIHTYLSSGTLVVPPHRDVNGNIISTVPCKYLLIAGGGGGGINHGGGGGAGGVLTAEGELLSGTVTVTVGAGGASNASGSNSVISDTNTSLTAVGGGKGGTVNTAGTNGGSGGGAGQSTDATDEAGGTETATQGNTGGANDWLADGGTGVSGGGGGAGADGESGIEEVPS